MGYDYFECLACYLLSGYNEPCKNEHRNNNEVCVNCLSKFDRTDRLNMPRVQDILQQARTYRNQICLFCSEKKEVKCISLCENHQQHSCCEEDEDEDNEDEDEDEDNE
jgi:hypothetical protein